jgi:Mg-chelatase subunit ChlD
MFSFVPSFQDTTSISTELETATDEMPEPQDLPPTLQQTSNFFIFIVDRSGSMSGGKMNTTNQALTLFLKSLPSGSRFDIISFGSGFKHMC